MGITNDFSVNEFSKRLLTRLMWYVVDEHPDYAATIARFPQCKPGSNQRSIYSDAVLQELIDFGDKNLTDLQHALEARVTIYARESLASIKPQALHNLSMDAAIIMTNNGYPIESADVYPIAKYELGLMKKEAALGAAL